MMPVDSDKLFPTRYFTGKAFAGTGGVTLFGLAKLRKAVSSDSFT